MTTYLGQWRIPGMLEDGPAQALLGIILQDDPAETSALMLYKDDAMQQFEVMAWFESPDLAQHATNCLDRILPAREFARIGGDHILEGLGLSGEKKNDHPGVEWVCSLDRGNPDPVRRITGDGMTRLWACPSLDGAVLALFTYVSDERVLLAEFESLEMADHFIKFVDGCHEFPVSNQ